MNCPACGNPLENDTQFCPKCFARIDPPGFWTKVLSFFTSKARPRQSVVKIKKTITIKTTDKDGQRHEYHSLDEAPPELASQIKKLESEALNQASKEALTSGIISRKTVTIFKVRDPSGKEHIYHSLDEMPSELRESVAKAGEQ
ncbi:MAG TPA: zinc ribbon domain-containing protein [Patescibacteria group bacterium]|nr:zinc ribbon domain-containing protein [Patescibacteria group bacterium]